MTLKNNRAPLLCYFKRCALFRSHWCIETGATVRKLPIWVKIGDFWSRVNLKFDGWTWKTMGHLFYVTSSFVHHLKPLSEFKLELLSGNAQFGSKSAIFVLCEFEIWRMTLKNNRTVYYSHYNVWDERHLFYAPSRFVHHSVAIGEFKLELQSGNAQFGSKSAIFLSRGTLKFEKWHWKK